MFRPKLWNHPQCYFLYVLPPDSWRLMKAVSEQFLCYHHLVHKLLLSPPKWFPLSILALALTTAFYLWSNQGDILNLNHTMPKASSLTHIKGQGPHWFPNISLNILSFTSGFCIIVYSSCMTLYQMAIWLIWSLTHFRSPLRVNFISSDSLPYIKLHPMLHLSRFKLIFLRSLLLSSFDFAYYVMWISL